MHHSLYLRALPFADVAAPIDATSPTKSMEQSNAKKAILQLKSADANQYVNLGDQNDSLNGSPRILPIAVKPRVS